MPNIYIIAGPNGAGKTTFATKYLFDELGCNEFVNADFIASGLSRYHPEKVAFKAGRLMLERLKQLAELQVDFAFETTLASRTFLPFLSDNKKKGYKINISYLWLNSYSVAIYRVRKRVTEGGHNVPEEDVRRRYNRSICNFINLYSSIANSWILYDNTNENPIKIASKLEGNFSLVFDKDIWEAVNKEVNDGKF